MRQTIRELGGTMPEKLPAVESINKIETKPRQQLARQQLARKQLGKTDTPPKKKSE